MSIRVRMAPSPTGLLHVGTARAALFNYIFAKHHGGTYILRIEDTDLERSDRSFEEDIFQGLAWLGIHADESPEVGGPFGPYRQTERTNIYRSYLETLLKQRQAFYCFHSEQELEDEKNEMMRMKRPALHLCEYRTLDPGEARLLKDTKSNYIIRFRTPPGKTIAFHDIIRGELKFESDLLGDFSIAKRIDMPLYHFAVVVDDITMKISHVIRGEDHIPNTPKHIVMFEALGHKPPQFAHLPLILGSDRSKLSKRRDATSITEYRNAGYLPEALINFLTLLGWSHGDDKELMTIDEMIEKFSLGRVQKSSAIFDLAKLDWMNGEYIRRKPLGDLVMLCKPFLNDFLQFPISNFQFSNNQDEYLKKIIALEQPRLKKLGELPERVDFFFRTPKYDTSLLRWKTMTNEELIEALGKSLDTLNSIGSATSKDVLQKAFFFEIGSGDKGTLLWPLRVALTGKKNSPGPFEIMEILGIEESRERVKRALEKLNGI